MLTKIMKVASISALLLAALFWTHLSGAELPLRFLVGLSAFLVAMQATRARKSVWAGGFYAVMLLFNPFIGVMTFSGMLPLLAVLAAAAAFSVSLTALRTEPLLSAPSITGRTPGSTSL